MAKLTYREVAAILNANQNEPFFNKIRAIQEDPAAYCENGDFSGCDFGEEDVSGYSFLHSRLKNANFSRVKNICDARFCITCLIQDPEIFDGIILPDGISLGMLMQNGYKHQGEDHAKYAEDRRVKRRWLKSKGVRIDTFYLTSSLNALFYKLYFQSGAK